MSDLEKAREFFGNDKYATKLTGIKIVDVKNQYAKCKLQLSDNHKNALGFAMGGVMFTLADFVFAIATNFGETKTVTTSSTINYLSSPKGDVLYGESRLLKDGKTNCFFEITITDNLNNLIAVVSTTGTHIHKK